MNIQFHKIHLPPLPKVNANALTKLVGSHGNSGFKLPCLPLGATRSKIVSRSNLDEIIRDIENGNDKNLTILEWVHCIYNKDKWDAKNIEQSISTSEAIWKAAEQNSWSEAIWKAAEQNSWLKQRLFWNFVLSYDDPKALALSLVKSYSAFSPLDQFNQEKLKIIQSFIKTNPAKELARLCINKNFTPYQLFQKYQLPTKSLILEQVLDEIIVEFTRNTILDRQVQWLLNCLEEMKIIQQIKAVEQLLIKVAPKPGAEHPELINWLRQYYGSLVPNSRWNELSSEAKSAMRKWLGAVSYQDFQRLVNLILNQPHIITQLRLEDFQQRRLRSRSKFWSNYSDRFERIRILLPQSSVEILGNHLNNQDVSILLEDGSDSTEVVIFDFGNWFVVEFFRGDGSETSIIRKDVESEQTLFHSQISVKRLRCLKRDIHDHEYCWQYFCEQLLRTKNIFPNENIQYFEGLSNEHGKYNRQTGLPKPSSYDLQQRKYKLERWEKTMFVLEQEAQTYTYSLWVN